VEGLDESRPTTGIVPALSGAVLRARLKPYEARLCLHCTVWMARVLLGQQARAVAGLRVG
jgi:hypothetical protein